MGNLKTRKLWTAKETEELQDLWGEKTIPQIAEIMGRSINSIKVKSTRLQLGAFKHNSEYLPALQASYLLGIDVHTVTDYWIPKCGLKFKHIAPLGDRKFTYIKFDVLVDWLKNNQDKWDSRRVALYALGQEYDWLTKKRNSDKDIPVRRAQKWTPHEDAQAICMFKQGKSYKEIGEVLGRSTSAVEHRISRLDVWGTGKYVPETVRNEIKAVRTKRQLQNRFLSLLKIRFNELNFDGYWQKDLCMNWDSVNGCIEGESNCDSCISFVRIKPQYCVRCGVTFLSRVKALRCNRCVKQRRWQHYRKIKTLELSLESKSGKGGTT